VPDWSSTFGPEKGAVIGAVYLGALGALVGLIRGLWVYPPTAWFAVIEVGLLAVIVGAVVGAMVGLAVRVFGRRNNRRVTSSVSRSDKV
jgi:hypothetical protein